MHRTVFYMLISVLIGFSTIFAQTAPQKPYLDVAMHLYTSSLDSCHAYSLLRELTTVAGSRLSGSPGAEAAVAWSLERMRSLGLDSVWTEKVMVPHWVRGPVEKATIVAPSSSEGRSLSVCALGGSVGTQEGGITAEVLEVRSFTELEAQAKEADGKIIFFNRPMDRTKLSVGEAYGGAVDQRSEGAVRAALAGGVGALVRSMTTRFDDVPHTGSMGYRDNVPRVPGLAVSTMGAEYLSTLIRRGQKVVLNIESSAQTLPDVESANVLGELKGMEHPEEIILLGAHLDAWDKGTGTHDDGAGVAQVIETLRLLKSAGLRPKRTIRGVLFMNEENGLRGGKDYAARNRPGERHLAAIETDAGGFAPRGLGVSCDSATFEKIASFAYLFEPIDADHVRKGGGGADISALADKGVPMIGLRVDGSRYFDYHHSGNDTFDTANEREVEMGASMLAVFVYVLAQEGL